MNEPLHTPLPAPRAVAPVLPPRRRQPRPDFLDLIVGRQLGADVERDGLADRGILAVLGASASSVVIDEATRASRA